VPYDDLSDDEKEKDRVHVRTMMRLMGHHPKQGMSEVAPPGDKAERMVRHIKQGYAQDGKLTPKEKGIAFATAWKAHNAGQLDEFARGDGPDRGNYLKELARAWYNMDFELLAHIARQGGNPLKHKIDVQETIEHMLERGIHCGDGRVRKYYIGYNSDFDGVEIQSHDHYEHSDTDDNGMDIDDRTGKPWGPYDVVEFSGDELDESITEAAQGHTIEAHGVRGMDRRTWHKTFRDTDQMMAWAEKHDAEIIGTRDLEQARHHNLSPAKQDMTEGETSTPAIYVKGGGKYPGMTIAPKGWSRIRDIKDEGDAYFVMVGNDGDGLNIPKNKVSLHRIKLKNGMPITAKQAFMMFNGWTPDREQGVAEGLTEMDKSEPSAGRDTGPREGPEKIAKPISKEKMVNHALDTLSKSMAKKDDKKKDVKESNTLMIKLKRALIREGRVKELADDLKAMSDADFMKKYGKAKAAIRADMKRVDEARTDYTPDEMSDMLSGKRSQKQIDADAERTRGPNKAPPTKESTQSRAKRLNEKLATGDTIAAGTGISRLGKKDMEPKLDFRTGLDVGDDESEFFEPDVRIGKPVEPDKADTDAFMSAVDSYGEQNPYMQSWGGKYADQDTRVAPLRPGEFNVGGTTWRRVEDPKKEVQWIPSSEADSIASWKANNPGKSAADWGSIPAASKSSAVGGSPNIRWNSQTRAQEKLDPRTGTWVPVPADASGANPNIDAATRDRARAWAAQQNAPGAALAGAMRSSGNPVDTAKSKTDWKTIYNLNKAVIGSNPNIIKPGMKLKMPDGSVYRVQPGDSLSKIAAGQINELSTDKLAQYKTAAARDAKQADQEGDFKRGDRRFHGMVQATKKQFDNDAKKVDENRAARRALMARIVNHR
jgi:hypothetical protein